ncbi:MAG: phospho-N-acetylmuramoyl-pentapeptide-transferase [Candidatus Nealsonbacteria bacterium]|nr:phospho-N-acetylmuramoyl-pentapeptide-transferase [Candidatus Nealsonbacteria bacterium]
MLLWLIDALNSAFPAAAAATAALGKITLRAALAAMIGFVLAVALGPRWIAWLKCRFREPIKCDSPEISRLHRNKQSTPTMGGLFIIAGLVAGVLFFGDLGNRYVQAALLLATGLTAIGAVDDLVKLRGSSNGISARCKLAGQVVVATVVAVLIYQHHAALPDGLQLRLPLLSGGISLGAWFIPAAVIVIVGSSNAVNLTDGLDGLAGGCLIFAAGAMTVVCYAAGHAELAQYLNIPRIPGAGELTVLGGAMIGGVLGFLWFNCHPAQVFMGDTGALPLGGLLGLLAVASRQELLLAVVGGVFVVEALSVIVQVGSYRWRRRRVFLCAPLHHHFQLKGWAENKIVVRFWIAAALCALLGVAGLKLTVNEPASSRPTDAATASVLK